MTIQVVVMLLLLIKARNPAAAVQLKLTVDTPTRREFFRRTSKVSSREETTSDHETVTFPAGSEDTDTADSHQFVITTSPELYSCLAVGSAVVEVAKNSLSLCSGYRRVVEEPVYCLLRARG